MSKRKSLAALALSIAVIVLLVVVACCGIQWADFPGVFSENGISKGIDLVGGSTITYEAVTDDTMSSSDIDSGLNSAVTMIRQRLDWMGLTEATVTRVVGQNRINVEIPAVTNPQEAVEKLGAMGTIIFKDSNGETVIDGEDIVAASAQYGDIGAGYPQNFVALDLTEEALSDFFKATGEMAALQGQYDEEGNPKNRIDIILDDEYVSRPTCDEAISRNPVIKTTDADEATWLANLIGAGKMPFAMTPIETRTVGATLGAEAFESSVIAGAIGLALVCVFMLIIYKLMGAVAVTALVAYVATYCILIDFLRINLSLPGIAGAILSIGMAVDANVVIFERIREELRAGKTLRSSIDGGFKNALSAVIDSNVTTIIAAIVLWVLGTGPVQGFAKTLFIGVVLSMFSAIILTRVLLKAVAGIKIVSPALYGVREINSDSVSSK